MKIALSIKVTYLPEWGAWEGIRELIQNGRDAELQYSAPLEIWHKGDTLYIENQGTQLEHDDLLLGQTSKEGRAELSGKYGEGLKLGTLALVRSGHAVKIRTGAEVWNPAIETGDKFKSPVLVFNIHGGNEPKNRVRVEVGGVSGELWKSLKERFLFLLKLKGLECIPTPVGDLLLGDFAGKLYNKGIFVQYKPEMNYGYNFTDVKLDRDRRMVESYDLRWTTAQIWKAAAAARPDMLKKFLVMVEENQEDVQGINEYSSIPKEISQAAAKTFVDKFGPNALPVATLAESEELKHLGATGIVVPKPLAQVLKDSIGDKETVQKRLRQEVIRMLSWDDLGPERQANLRVAIDLLHKVHPACALDLIDVVEYRSGKAIEGMYKDGRVQVSEHMLDDSTDALAVLVHEFAHAYGGDGSKSHVAVIENLWQSIVRHLRMPA